MQGISHKLQHFQNLLIQFFHSDHQSFYLIVSKKKSHFPKAFLYKHRQEFPGFILVNFRFFRNGDVLSVQSFLQDFLHQRPVSRIMTTFRLVTITPLVDFFALT